MNVVVLFRNAPYLAERCLRSLRDSLREDQSFLLIDDCSDPGREVLHLLEEFRFAVAPAKVRVIRFNRQMHYGHGLAYALSMSAGMDVLFVSHDMMISPDCVAALLKAASADERIGIVRPVSEHMDWAKKFVVKPPQPPATTLNVADFAAQVRQQANPEPVDWPMLIGDAMYIKRSVIDRIGVFDTRFYGFMADIDYGVRARRAGFRHVIAPAAWLHHEGAGAAKESGDAPAHSAEMMRLVNAAYDEFRRKWGEENFPVHFRDMRREHFDSIYVFPPMRADAVIPPIELTPDVGEEV